MTVGELTLELAKFPVKYKVRIVRDERMSEIEDVTEEENYGDGRYVVITI